MYYTEAFIDELEKSKKLEIPRENFLEVSAKGVAALLDQNPLIYKTFGVYWWAVKDALREYVHNGAWYCGAVDNRYIKENNWHGSLFRTVLAGMYYMSEETGDIIEANPSDFHYWYEEVGEFPVEEREYRLFDDNLGL